MAIVDLLGDFERLVRGARTNVEFKRRFREWLDAQQQGGPLAPLIGDMVRLWSGTGSGHGLGDARSVLRRLAGRDFERRAAAVVERFTAVARAQPECDVVLFAGLRRPEGYSRFDRGRNTVFVALDHASNLRHLEDHLELILAHELTHAVRDPSPGVLAEYDGWSEMTHDDFVERHPFREHLVSEALATAVSERIYPGQPEHRYIYFTPEDHAWCETHRAQISERMRRALADGEDYGTFYARGSVTPDSPDCCDYYFGLHLGRYALAREEPQRLLRLPATEFLDRFLSPFVDSFVAVTTLPLAVDPAAAASGADGSIDARVLPEVVSRLTAVLAAELTRRPAQALEAARALERAVAGERLEYAGKPHEVGLFPLVLSAEDERYLRWVTERLLGTVERMIELYRRDPELRAYFGFSPHLERLILAEPGYRPFVPVGRFDSFWNGKRVRFLELNTNGTAAIVLGDRIGPLFLALPELGPLAARSGAQALPLVRPLIDALLDCWRQAADSWGLRARPERVAIVDWAGLATARELEQLARAIEGAGIPAVVAEPSALGFDGTRLRAGGEPIDLVYRRLTVGDVQDRTAELIPLLEAAASRRAVVVGSFAADVAHSKRMLAVLTHERWRRHLSMEERSLIDAHVPWTRMLRSGLTLLGGRLRDVRELALAERERFVLKPAEGAEGRDVILGIEASPAEWEAEVTRRYGGGHILQERVDAPVRTFSTPTPDGVVPQALHLHLGEFMFGGVLAGFLARVSTSLVLSARSDDRAIPCLVVPTEEEDRSSGLSHP